MNLLDFFAMGGQERRRMLDDYVDDLNLERFLPPNLRPAGQFVAEANPVAAMGNAMQAGGVVFDPDATAEARKRAAVDMGVEMAMSLAPAALVRAGYLAAPAGLTEMFATPTGEVIGPMVRNAVSDAQYAGRSLAEGDLGGIFDAFRPSGQPQSVGAAGIGDNGGPPLDQVPARASLFSPSLRAAENLKQNKGTYEQMRGMLLKGGGKEAELEWSGMDRAFAGQKVTKDDLISYLRENDPRLQQTTVSARVDPDAASLPEGTMLRSDFDFGEWFDENIASDAPLMSEEVNITVDNLAYDLHSQDFVQHGPDLPDYEVEALAEATGESMDDIRNSEYVIYRGGGDLFLSDDSYDTVMHVYGEDFVEQEARDRLYEHYDYVHDFEPDNFEQISGLTFIDDVDEVDGVGQGVVQPRETRFSDYMPEGYRSYNENFFTYTDPTGQFEDYNVAGASHFGRYDDKTQYHTRTGDYQTTNTVGGRPFNARYVAEIQSDAQQNIDPSFARTYDEGVDLSSMSKEDSVFRERDRELEREYHQRNRAMDDAITRLQLNSNHLPNQRSSFDYMAKVKAYNRIANEHNSRLDAEGVRYTYNNLMGRDFGRMPLIDENMDISSLNSGQLEDKFFVSDRNVYSNVYPVHSDYTAVAYDPQMREKIGLTPEHAKELEAAQMAVERTALARANAKRLRSDARDERVDEFIQKHDRHPATLKLGGPMMASQNRWVDDAIRRSIIDAVNDDSVDFLAFPKDERAIGKVGGSTNPKQGTIDFYNRDVQNRLRGILRKIDKDARVQDIGLESGANDIEAYGLRITPEFRRRVKEQGLPTFAAFGAMPLLGVFDYLREQKEKRNERLGGLMGYGGL